MSVKDWQALLSGMQVEGTVKPVRAGVIRQFEKDIGFRLPKSYCDYCKVFGAGFLSRPYHYTIAVPGAKYERFSLGFRCKLYPGDIPGIQEDTAEGQQLKRGWFFAD